MVFLLGGSLIQGRMFSTDSVTNAMQIVVFTVTQQATERAGDAERPKVDRNKATDARGCLFHYSIV